MGQDRLSPPKVASASTALHVSMIVCVAIITRRRSATSATNPPINEQTIIGTARNAPTNPNAKAEFVSK